MVNALFAKANRRALFFCSIFVFGAILYGYDGTYFTGILAMKTFLKDFGELQPNGTYAVTSGQQALYASIVQVGEVVGSLSAGFIGDRSGRKGAMLAAITLVAIGTILQLIVTGNRPLLVVGRLVLGAGVGVISNCTTLYLSEIPPASIRGTIVSGWQLFLAIGQVIGAGVAQGTKDYSSTFSYRFPIALNIAICLVIFTGLFVVPESPRWLLSKGRVEDARVSLLRVHKNSDEVDVEHEIKIVLDAKAAEAEESGGESTWSGLFKGTQKKKFFGAFGILVGQQIGGVQFIFSYGTVFFESIGQDDPFLITIITDIVEVVGVLCSFFIVNRYGRRPLLVSTALMMATLMIVMGILGCIKNPSKAVNKAVNSAIASMIIIYVFVFNLAWGGLAWVVATELAAGKNRTKIMGVATASFWIAAWAVTFTLPYLYDDKAGSAGLGAKVGFIYGGGALISAAFVYFYIPETLNRSLEDINMMIELKVPTKAWPSYQCQIDERPAESWKGETKGQRFEGKRSEHVEDAGVPTFGDRELNRQDSD